MTSLVLVVQHLVPLLVFWSVVLVAARWLHDRLVPRGPGLARIVMSGILLAGGAASAMPLAKIATLAVAHDGYAQGDWRRGATWYLRHWRLGASLDDTASLEWAICLVNLRMFADAEVVLGDAIRVVDRGVVAIPRVVLLRGVSRYFLGNFAGAAADLRGLPPIPDSYVADYFLGRLAERAGDRAGAIAAYRRALVPQPGFLPATYHLARLLAGSGDRPAAAALVHEYLRRFGEGNGALLLPFLSGADLADREFLLIEH